jgi:hypothetical protein
MEKISALLMVWAIFNILFGSIFCGIPALIYSNLHRKGKHEFRNKAIIWNLISTIFGIIVLIYIIIYFTSYNLI